jgi:filamentous hemagglutinin
MLKAIDPTGADLNPGQQAAMAGFATLLGGGLAGLAGANAQGGATAAQNEVLNNTDDHPATAAKNGGVLGTLAGAFSDLVNANNAAKSWVQGQVNQFIGLMNANSGQTGPSDANNQLPGGGNDNNPSGTAGAVVTPSVPIPTPYGGVVMTPPLIAPGTPILSSGGSGDNTGSSATGQGPASSNVGFDTSNLESKLGGYLLDPAHPQNQTKANWFSQALGFDQSNWQDLASQLYFDPATAVPTKTTQYGQTYEQVIPITGANGKTIDTTFVFMKDNSGTVRLVTGIPAKK